MDEPKMGRSLKRRKEDMHALDVAKEGLVMWGLSNQWKATVGPT